MMSRTQAIVEQDESQPNKPLISIPKLIAGAGLLFGASTLLAACSIVGDIFKAGAAIGVIAVIIVLGIIFWIVGKFRK